MNRLLHIFLSLLFVLALAPMVYAAAVSPEYADIVARTGVAPDRYERYELGSSFGKYSGMVCNPSPGVIVAIGKKLPGYRDLICSPNKLPLTTIGRFRMTSQEVIYHDGKLTEIYVGLESAETLAVHSEIIDFGTQYHGKLTVWNLRKGGSRGVLVIEKKPKK